MGYLLLSIALLAGVTKGYCGKKTSGYVEQLGDALSANIIRMLFCIGIGFLVVAFSGELPSLKPSPTLMLITALSGISTSLFVVSWLLSVKKGAYMMVEVFLMLGVLVPILLGRFFLSETVRFNQILGLGLLIVAVLLMCSYNTAVKGKIQKTALIFLILCGLANGLTDFSQRLFVHTMTLPASVFNFYTYIFSAGTLLLISLFLKNKEVPQKDGFVANFKKIFWYILVMALCLFANSYFKTQAATYLDSTQLYPLNQGMSLILSTLMSAILFKEKPNLKCVAGIILSFVALLLINVL